MLDKLVDFMLQFLKLGQFWVVLNCYEGGVILRFGKFVKVVDPGFHWRWPLGIDELHYETIAIRTTSLGALATTTTDGKQVGFEVIVTHKIHDIQTALLKVDKVEDAIKDACLGTVGQTLTLTSWADMNKQETLDMLTKACRARGWKYGVEVISVQLAGVSLVRNFRIMNTQHHKYE